MTQPQKQLRYYSRDRAAVDYFIVSHLKAHFSAEVRKWKQQAENPNIRTPSSYHTAMDLLIKNIDLEDTFKAAEKALRPFVKKGGAISTGKKKIFNDASKLMIESHVTTELTLLGGNIRTWVDTFAKQNPKIAARLEKKENNPVSELSRIRRLEHESRMLFGKMYL